MPKRKKDDNKKHPADKPGSNPDAATTIGGKSDFGIPAKEAIEQATHKDDEYAARPKGTQMSQTGEGSAREHGVGAKGGKRGRGSGGEIDLDLIGFGTPGAGPITTGPINEPPGPDDADKAIDAPHGRKPIDGPNIGGDKRVQRRYHGRTPAATNPPRVPARRHPPPSPTPATKKTTLSPAKSPTTKPPVPTTPRPTIALNHKQQTQRSPEMITKLLLATFTCTLFCAVQGCEPSTAPRDGVAVTTERPKRRQHPSRQRIPRSCRAR